MLTRLVPLLLAAAAGSLLTAPDASAQAAGCTELAEPSRWTAAGTPDRGRTDPILSAHRGGTTLAPEHTLDSYETASAYGIDVLEIDVRTTSDGRQVVIHDDTLARTTDVEALFPDRAPWAVRDFTLAEIQTLNAADYGPFRLSAPPSPKQAYNPSRVPTVEAVIALAGRVGAGIEADLKDAERPIEVVELAAAAGIVAKSFFGEPERPDVRAQILAAAPDAQFIYNIGAEPPGSLYSLGSTGVRYFGSSLNEFTAEKIAEIHDACGLAIPHAYDSDPPTSEGEDILVGRSRGTDGAQIDAPDVAVDAIDRPVATRLVQQPGQLCLVNATNGLGLPYKQLTVDGAAVETSKNGCAPVAGELRAATWRGDGSALTSAFASAAPVVPEAPWAALLPLAALAAGWFVVRRTRSA